MRQSGITLAKQFRSSLMTRSPRGGLAKSETLIFPIEVRKIMSTVAKVIELTSSSPKSIEDAVETGIAKADVTLDHIESAWVQEIKCIVKNGKVAEWRVNMKVTFLLK
jgi:flavin-binding protein dodecin